MFGLFLKTSAEQQITLYKDPSYLLFYTIWTVEYVVFDFAGRSSVIESKQRTSSPQYKMRYSDIATSQLSSRLSETAAV